MAFRLISSLLLFIAANVALEYYFYRCALLVFGKKKWLRQAMFGFQAIIAMGWIAVMTLFIAQITPDQSIVSSLFIILVGNIVHKLLFALFSLLRLLCKRHKTGAIAAAFIVSSGIWIVIGVGIHNAHHPETKSLELAFDNLPAAFDGYRIALITDTHLGTFGNNSHLLERAATLIEEASPDILLHGGDWISTTADETIPHRNAFAHIRPADGKYSVMGNHDYVTYARSVNDEQRTEQVNRLKQYVTDEGFVWLDDTACNIHRGNDSITLIGVQNWGESRMGKHGDLQVAMQKVTTPDSAFKVLLSHNPEHFRQEVADSYPIDLTLSGHTHAMQLVIEIGNWRFSPAQWVYEYWSGVYKQNGRTLVVSEGLGATLYAMRIGSPAEVLIITLRRKS